MLEALIKMWSCYLVGEKTIRLVLELIHNDPKYASAGFARTSTGSFHYAEIATCTNGKSRFRQELAHTHGLAVFGIAFHTFRAAKNRDDAFVCLSHFRTSAVNINEPFCLYCR